jgi:hypothetical protein
MKRWTKYKKEAVVREYMSSRRLPEGFTVDELNSMVVRYLRCGVSGLKALGTGAMLAAVLLSAAPALADPCDASKEACQAVPAADPAPAPHISRIHFHPHHFSHSQHTHHGCHHHKK